MNDHHHKLVQRKVQFDYSDSPLHWIPGEPEASHAINVIHMMLPAGELWFCRLYNKALPFVKEGGCARTYRASSARKRCTPAPTRELWSAT